MSFIAVRGMVNALIERKRLVCEHLATIEGLMVDFTPQLAEVAANGLPYYEDEDAVTEEAELIRSLAGQRKPFLSIRVLTAIAEQHDRGVAMLSDFESIQKLAPCDLKPVPLGSEPNLEGLLPEEVASALDVHRLAINQLTHDLRNIHTEVQYIRRVDKRTCSRRTGDAFKFDVVKFEVMERSYLGARIGAEAADIVMRCVEGIESVSAPLPGEPSTLRFYSSHTTNEIKVQLPAVS